MGGISPERRIGEISRSRAETDVLIKAIGGALEEMLPRSAVCFSRISRDRRTLNCGYVSQTAPSLKAISEGDLTDARGFTYQVCLREELLIIPDVGESVELENAAPILTGAGFTSCIARRIQLSPEEVWGCIAIYFALSEWGIEERRAFLNRNEVWIQLAVSIIERRLLEQSLHILQLRSEFAVKAGGVGIFDWDIAGDSLFWSPSMIELFGFAPGEFTGRYECWSQRVFPEDVALIERDMKRAFESREKFFRTRQRLRLESGVIRHVDSLGEIIYNEGGEPLRIIGTARDCTQELQVAEQMSHDRRRLELALEAGELGFWDWDVVSGAVQFGGEWGRMLGYDLSELKPHVSTWESLVHPDDKASVTEVLKKHLEGQSLVYESEHRLRAKDGSWVWVLDRGRVVERDIFGKPLRAIGVHSNITTQRRVRELLKEADRRKDEFLATLAHELRNPLAPIRTGLAIIKRDPGGAPAGKAREMMERQLTHMVHLIDDLLDVSRITTGRLILKKESVPLRSVIDLGVEASKPLIDAGHHTLRLSIKDGDVRIFGDVTRLSQIVSNILTNAAKYTPDHGLIELSTHRTDGRVEISIRDNGLGIPAEMLEHVFDLFGQVNRTLDRSQGGLGIGLALVRSLVSEHHGVVTALSEGEGKGSTFVVQLPVDEVAHAPEIAEVSGVNGGVQRHHRVLIVDDNRDGAETLSMYTKLLGHQTEVANSGPEAIEKVTVFKPDIVFLDIGLPGMSGFDVAKLIKGMPEAVGTKLVAVTGWGSEDTKRRAHEAGFDEHLTKPVELGRIESILST